MQFKTIHIQLFHSHDTGQPVSQHTQLRTGRFCSSKVLMPACPYWRQLVHSDYGEYARLVLFTPSPYHNQDQHQNQNSKNRVRSCLKSQKLHLAATRSGTIKYEKVRNLKECVFFNLLSSTTSQTPGWIAHQQLLDEALCGLWKVPWKYNFTAQNSPV